MAVHRILIADDSADFADTLALLLELNGFEVAVAYGGLNALESAETYHPDVVVLDVSLWGCDDNEVCRQLRAKPWAKDALIIAGTAWTGTRRLDALRAGCDHHLLKPFPWRELVQLIEAHRR